MGLDIVRARNTLGHQLGARPSHIRRDVSSASMQSVSKAFKTFLSTIGSEKVTPEEELVRYYLLEHLVSELKQMYHPHQPIENASHQLVLEKYNQVMNEQVARLFYYTLIICIREARHCKNVGAMKTKGKSKWGEDTYSFIGVIPDDAGQAMDMLKNNPPAIALGKCTGALTDLFYDGSWNSQYGGKKWGDIASCLHKFVTGVYSPLLFMDVAYTLCHNNGPIFNKGMLYAGYSSYFTRFLDIQRAGMIPQLFMLEDHHNGYAHFSVYLDRIDIDTKKLWNKVRDSFKFEHKYVVWKKVALSSPSGTNYYEEENYQKKLWGISEEEAKLNAEIKALKAKKEEEAKKKKEEESAKKKALDALKASTQSVEITPGFYATKVKRAKI